jgi:hypothetical protein
LKQLCNSRLIRGLAAVFGAGLIVSVYQNCAPVGDAPGVGTASSLSGGGAVISQCIGKAPPTITSAPGNQPAATVGLGRFSGTLLPQNLAYTIVRSYSTQANTLDCDVAGVDGINVNDGDPADVDINTNGECLSGTATVTCRAIDNLCQRTSNEVSFSFSVTNVCPAEIRDPNPDAEQNDQFGGRVAISGTTAVVLAISDNEQAADAGAAYVYNWNGSDWVITQKLMPGSASDISLSSKELAAAAVYGDTIVLGAPSRGSHGIAYVYKRSGGVFNLAATLTPSAFNGTSRTTKFGQDVAVSANVIAVGAPGYSHGNPTMYVNAGTVFVYDAASLSEIGSLVASDRAANDWFGARVAASGTRIAVGAPIIETGDIGSRPGKAYVFNSGAETKLEPGSGAAKGARFGSAVAIDGTRVAVGAKGADGRGAVFIFDGATNPKKFDGPDTDDGDQFGTSVSLVGNTLAVGAPRNTHDNADQSGAAYIFKYSGTAWNAGYKMVPREAGRGQDHQFGESVAISGSTFVGGSRLDDVGALNSGTVFFIAIP